MRYLLLIYSEESTGAPDPAEIEQVTNEYWAYTQALDEARVKQGGEARVLDSRVNADVQYDSNGAALEASRNVVGGSVQVFQNHGGVRIAANRIDGNLQCKENQPAPTGGANVVQGNKEDQCAGL